MKVTLEDLLALGLSERAWIRNMPPLLADIVRLVGVEATLRLALHYGGDNLYIPAWASDRPGSDPDAPKKWKLTRVVGEEAAIKIVDHFGAGYSAGIQLPTGLQGRIYRRLIGVAMFEKGATIRDVCQTVGIARSIAFEWRKQFVDPEVVPERPKRPSRGDEAKRLFTEGLPFSEVLQRTGLSAHYLGRIIGELHKADPTIAIERKPTRAQMIAGLFKEGLSEREVRERTRLSRDRLGEIIKEVQKSDPTIRIEREPSPTQIATRLFREGASLVDVERQTGLSDFYLMRLRSKIRKKAA